MKACVLAFCCLCSAALAGVPALSMPAPKIELPSLSLLDRAKPGLGLVEAWQDAAQMLHLPSTEAKRSTSAPTVSAMPVVPAPAIDPKMAHAPKPGIGYKLLIKKPGVETTRSGRQLGTPK